MESNGNGNGNIKNIETKINYTRIDGYLLGSNSLGQ